MLSFSVFKLEYALSIMNLKLEVSHVFKEIGNTFKREYGGFEAWLLSSNFQALKFLGLKPSKKIPLKNAAFDVDVAQDVVVTELDCGTLRGLDTTALMKDDEVVESLAARIEGRTSVHDVLHPQTGEILVRTAEEMGIKWQVVTVTRVWSR